MKRTSLLFGILLLGWAVPAQSMTLYPGKTILETVAPGGIEEPEIWAVNQTNGAVTFEYALVQNTLNPAWYAYICDNQICYSSVISGAVMAPHPAADSLLIFKLTAIPQGIMDSGRVVYAVWDQAVPADTQWVTFLFNMVITTAEEPTVSVLEAYPSPARTHLQLQAGTPLEPVQVELYDTQGRMVREGTITGQLQWEVADLPAGVYLLRYQQAGLPAAARKVIIQP